MRDTKVTALAKAQNAGQAGKTFPAGFLLTTIMTLATAWSAANPFGLSLDPEAAKRPAVLRRHLAEAVRLLAE